MGVMCVVVFWGGGGMCIRRGVVEGSVFTFCYTETVKKNCFK